MLPGRRPRAMGELREAGEHVSRLDARDRPALPADARVRSPSCACLPDSRPDARVVAELRHAGPDVASSRIVPMQRTPRRDGAVMD